MATKSTTAEQHELLHKHWPGDCCLCKTEAELSSARDALADKGDFPVNPMWEQEKKRQKALNKAASASIDAAEDIYEKRYLSLRSADNRLETRLEALSIAASVFSQISNTKTRAEASFHGRSFEQFLPRTLKDFRESVDAVFKAAGLKKVKWE